MDLRNFELRCREHWESWLLHDLDRGHLTAEQKDYFETKAVWLCARVVDVGKRNGERLAALAHAESRMIHRIRARYPRARSHSKISKRPASEFDGLRDVINLVRGCKVMITRNVAYALGLAKGTRGTLVGVIYGRGQPVGTFPEAIIVDVPDYTGEAFYEGEPTWVRILPMSAFNSQGQERFQFPLVAGYAISVNKSQGLTLEEGVVIHLASSGRSFIPAAKHGMPFVAFTRSENFAMTAFKNLPPIGEFMKGRQSSMLRMRRAFEEMLERMHERTLRQWDEDWTPEKEQELLEEWRAKQAGKRHKSNGPKMRCLVRESAGC